MGLFGFGGGIKIACSQCDKKIKGAHVTRRQLPFCSAACEQAFVAQHPIAPAHGGTADTHRVDALNRLVAGLGELHAVARDGSLRFGTSYRAGGTTITLELGAGVPIVVDDDGQAARDALYRFDALALESLPYLYAIGRTEEAEQLERLSLESIRDGLPGTIGSIAGVARTVHALIVRLADA